MGSSVRAIATRVGHQTLSNGLARQTLMAAIAPIVSRKRVEDWPAWAAVVNGVRVPRSVVPHPKPEPSGGAHPAILLELLDRTADVPGDIAECGVYRGETLLLVAIALRQRGSSKRIIGIDSFEGFGDEIRFDMALGGGASDQRAIGAFADTSYDGLRRRARALNVEPWLEIRKGYFSDTFQALGERTYSFLHLDCDIYSSYKEALEYFYPLLAPGSIVLLDEYNDPPWPGCNLAVDEFLAARPETLSLVERDNHQKWYFEKKGSG